MRKLYIIESRKEGEVAIILIQFNFKNFKSFREEATLDLSAAKMTEFSDRVVTVGSEKILPVAAIYGANASGKSNIYNAFEYMSEYVADSFKYGDEEEKFEEFRPTPFLFDSTSADAESSFEVYFTLPSDKSERSYNYGFCINKEGVTEEWLNSKAKTARKYSTVFYRGATDEELDLSGFPKSSRDNIQVALEKQVLIISLGAKLKIGKCKAIRDWFLANEFADFGDPFTNFFMSRRLPKGFVEDKNVQQKVVEYFASFDEHIKDFRIEKVPQEAESKEERYKINALHKMIDSDEMAEIPLGLESAGTLKMFALYPELQEVLEKGSVFFIDELNVRLDPLLVRNFLLTFLNPEINTNHAQLVFTTHDTWQLSNQLNDLLKWFEKKDFEGRWMPEGYGQLYECCIGEYPWNPTMVNYLEQEEEQDFRQENPAPCYLVTTANDYTAEKDSPFCTNEESSYMFPSKYLMEQMNLTWNGSFGYAANGSTVIVNGQNNALFIKKKFLLEFIEQNELDVVWTVLGEKQKITGGFGRDFPGRAEFSYTYYINEKEEVSRNHKVYNIMEAGRY